MKKGLQVLTVLVLGQLILLGLYLGVQGRRDAGPIAVDRLARPAPELTLRSRDGTVSRLSEQRGSVVVLHFWATWCPPCREELPALLGFAASGPPRVLAVSVDPEWPALESFVGGESWESVYLASGDEVSAAFGVDELPQTFVIDAAGTLRLHFRGARDWDSRKLRALIATLGDP